MNKQLSIDKTNTLLSGPKGLLAMDESNGTCNACFNQCLPQLGALHSYRVGNLVNWQPPT